MADRRQLIPMEREDAIRLLASVSLGRIVFTSQALPAIRPVNHLVDDGDLIVRTHIGAAITSAVTPTTPGVVVAYEADQIDPDSRLGWSVVVTGVATAVTDPDEIARFEGRLEPWIDQPMDQVVRIVPDLVTGYRLTNGTEPAEDM
ncbi:pyridoxamine 5'-phosphate oxidase family protein [Phytoactinopolyspora halotolerans]|uniref:Pyridoxamine 5'-phosphate oxidase family protein n=1 Tax=Phytoactinopolyspora halotolerans TaxID=1981512 RepID=A0A6L9S7Y6_9ACTN|nr:pyridoxamine 5'-phosphate oxidase family protein [Phytoactinopolyspora halotolerans]NEE00638.1 pyridoxamine 5'-phosphate oxidase family protein [Phytoactinopolyspora halotolerans]